MTMTSSVPWVFLNLVIISTLTCALKVQPAPPSVREEFINRNTQSTEEGSDLEPGPAPGLKPSLVHGGPTNRGLPGPNNGRSPYAHNKHGIQLPLTIYLREPTVPRGEGYNKRRIGGPRPPQKRNVPPPAHRNAPPRYGYQPRPSPGRGPVYGPNANRPRTHQGFNNRQSGRQPSRATPETSESSSVTTTAEVEPHGHGQGQGQYGHGQEPFEVEHRFESFDTISYSKLYQENNGFDTIPEKVDAILKAQAKPYGKKPITYGHLGFTGNFFNSPKPVPKAVPRPPAHPHPNAYAPGPAHGHAPAHHKEPKNHQKEKPKKKAHGNGGGRPQRADHSNQNYDGYGDEYQHASQMSERTDIDDSSETSGHYRKREPAYESSWHSYADHSSAWQAKDRPSNQNSYNQNSYNQNSYNQNSHNQNSYNQNNYNQNSYESDDGTSGGHDRPAESSSYQTNQNLNQHNQNYVQHTQNQKQNKQSYNQNKQDQGKQSYDRTKYYEDEEEERPSQNYGQVNQNYQTQQWQDYSKKQDEPKTKNQDEPKTKNPEQTYTYQTFEQADRRDQGNQKYEPSNQKFDRSNQKYDLNNLNDQGSQKPEVSTQSQEDGNSQRIGTSSGPDMSNMQWQSFHKNEDLAAFGNNASASSVVDRWAHAHEEPNIWNNVHDGYRRLVNAQSSGDVGSEWNAKFSFWDTNNYNNYPVVTREPDVHNINYVKQYFKRNNG